MLSQVYAFRSLDIKQPSISKAAGVISSSICDLALTVISRSSASFSTGAMKRLAEQTRENDKLGKESHVRRFYHLMTLRACQS